MSKFTLYHSIKVNYEAEELSFTDYDIRTAVIETDSIEKAFELSQNLYKESWIHNKEVTLFDKTIEGLRSTCVGDIVCDQDKNKYFMFEDVGYCEILIKNGMIIKIKNLFDKLIDKM